MEEYEKIQLRSEEVNDILGRPPSWIIRWGITVFFLTLLAILAISYMVKYPDTVEAPILLTTPSPPTKVVAERSGRLLQFNVENEANVMKGSVIALFESAADYDDVLRLEKILNKAIQSQEPFKPPLRMDLGDIQLAYSDYQRDYKEYSYKSTTRFDKDRVERIHEKQTSAERKLNATLAKERRLKKNISETYARIQEYRTLVEQGSISVQRLNNEMLDYEKMERKLEDIKDSIADYNDEIQQYEKEKIRVQRSTLEVGNDKLFRLQDSMNKLSAEIDNWKKKYIIYAPVSGKATLFDVRASQQYIQSGQDIMMIVSEQDEILGMMGVPVAGAGKIEKGDVVNIALHEYPSKEYGVIKGTVERISLIPRDNKYQVEITLPEGLQTTYQKQLDFKQEMSGVGKIVTDKKRFLYRVFEQLFDLVKVS